MITTPIALGVDVGPPRSDVAFPVTLRSFGNGPPTERHQRPVRGAERLSLAADMPDQPDLPEHSEQAAGGALR